jgi:hypothetical protein
MDVLLSVRSFLDRRKRPKPKYDVVRGRTMTHEERLALSKRLADDPATHEALMESRARHGEKPIDLRPPIDLPHRPGTGD